MITYSANYENKGNNGTTAPAHHTGISEKLNKAIAQGCLRMAKGLAALLGVGMAVASGVCALNIFAWGCYLISQFAKGMAVSLPLSAAGIFHTTALQGIDLMFGGIAFTLAGIVLFAVMAAILLLWKIVKSSKQ